MDALQGVGIGARRGQRLSEEVVAAAVADLSSNRRVEDGVDRQSQGDDTVAAVDRLQRVGVGARRGERLPKETVAASFADCSGKWRVEGRVHRQRQRDDAVATVDALQRVGVGASRSQRLSVEVVATTLTDRSGNRRVEDRVARQRQRDDTVAAVYALQRVGVGARRGQVLPEEAVAVSFANRSGDRRVEDGVDRQRQGDDTVAAVDSLQRVGVGARRGQVLPEEAVAISFANRSGDRRVEDGVDR